MQKYTVVATQKIEYEVEAETPIQALNRVIELHKEGILFQDKDYIETNIKLYDGKESENV